MEKERRPDVYKRQEQYRQFNFDRIKECISLQEKIGLDVLVHGEFERNDICLLYTSDINLEVSGAGTSLTVSAAQTKTGMTTGGEVAVLNLGKNGGGQQSILYGDLIVNGCTLNTTAGDQMCIRDSL